LAAPRINLVGLTKKRTHTRGRALCPASFYWCSGDTYRDGAQAGFWDNGFRRTEFAKGESGTWAVNVPSENEVTVSDINTMLFARSACFWVEFDRSFYMFGLLLTKNRGKYPNDKTNTKTNCLLYTNNRFDGECG
jgi:hypothetical protein